MKFIMCTNSKRPTSCPVVYPVAISINIYSNMIHKNNFMTVWLQITDYNILFLLFRGHKTVIFK